LIDLAMLPEAHIYVTFIEMLYPQDMDIASLIKSKKQYVAYQKQRSMNLQFFFRLGYNLKNNHLGVKM